MDPFAAADFDALDRLTGRITPGDERERALTHLASGDTRRALRQAAPNHPPSVTFSLAATPPRGKDRVVFRAGPAPRFTGDTERLAFADVPTLARLLKNGAVTATQLTQMYLERLRRFDPILHCVVERCEERALAEAAQADREISAGAWRGPLHGVPYGVKDLLSAEGTSWTAGATPWKERRSVGDAAVVARLKAAGAVLIAKLSMGELAWGDVWFGGTTRNPWNPEEGSSGSSAGSASAVAAGLVGFAIGSETYGSIVSPCMACGATGLRPTFGRVSRTGAIALSWTMDKIGPICRGVEDCALVFAAIHGADPGDPASRSAPFLWSARRSLSGLRVGIDDASFADEKAHATQREAREVLRRLGVTMLPIRLPERREGYDALPGLTLFAEASAAYADLVDEGKLCELVSTEKRDWPGVLRAATTVTAADYWGAQRLRRRLQEEMEIALDDVDVYVTASGVGPSLPFTNLTGHPEVVTRCGHDEAGMPRAISFVGALFRDDAALQLAHAFARAAGSNRRWPEAFRGT